MTSDVPVAGLVLAAGDGPDGVPEALAEHAGSLRVEVAVRTAAAVCDPVLVVLGARAVDVWRTADLAGATVLADAGWESGQASSLRAEHDEHRVADRGRRPDRPLDEQVPPEADQRLGHAVPPSAAGGEHQPGDGAVGHPPHPAIPRPRPEAHPELARGEGDGVLHQRV